MDLFQGVADLEELVRDCPRISLTDREMVFEYGDPGASMYIILDGQILVAGTPAEVVAHPVARKEYLGENFSL